MRELIGKIPTSDPNVTEKVYLCEYVRCRECQKTAPIGIEVVAIKRDGDSNKVVWHGFYCRDHGLDYESRVQNQPIRPHDQHWRESH